MPFGKGRRRLWMVLGGLLAGLIAVWVACLLWFPWLLRPLGSKAGLQLGRYERLGYSRFCLHDINLTSESLVLHAQQVDALVPSVWLWRLARGQPAQDAFLRVT